MIPLTSCTDVVSDVQASEVERMIAVDAMVAIRDPRLNEIASGVASADAHVAGQYRTGRGSATVSPRSLSRAALSDSKLDQGREAIVLLRPDLAVAPSDRQSRT